MDQYNQGMDPEIKLYFRKILKSFSLILLWFLVMMTLGLFFRLGYAPHGFRWYNIVFYIILALSLFTLLRSLFKTWRKT